MVAVPEFQWRFDVIDYKIFTIGHGGRTMDDVITQLKSWSIEYVIDVRSAPYSRYQPGFSKDSLARSLAQAGMKYVYMGHQLGGRPDDPTCYTENGNVNYSEYRSRAFFQEGISRLKRAGEQGYRVCLICSEGNPKSCHRSALVGAVLEDMEVEVVHLLPSGGSKSQYEVMRDRTGGQLSFDGSDFGQVSRKAIKAKE